MARRERRSKKRSRRGATAARSRITLRRSNRFRRSRRWRISAGDDESARTLLEESLDRHRRVYGERARANGACAGRPRAGGGVEATWRKRSGCCTGRSTSSARRSDRIIRRSARRLAALGGYYYRREGLRSRAGDFFRQALDVFPTRQDRRNPIAITILNDFAASSRLNEYAEAEAQTAGSDRLGREVLGAETMTVANWSTASGRRRHIWASTEMPSARFERHS